MNETITKIILVDDHPVVRDGLREFINREADLKVIAEAEDFNGAIQQLTEQQIDLAIVDLSLKEMQSGIDLVKKITADFPDIRVLVLSMHDETVYAERVLKAGALGYVMKHEAGKKILDSIRTVASGELAVSEKVSGKIMKSFIRKRNNDPKDYAEKLSDRELEVFCMIGRGIGTSDIARTLGLSISTVETYRAHIKEKLQVEKSSELVKIAVEWAMSHRY
jgi:DNA-binding NarL/FixJ family response regulator